MPEHKEEHSIFFVPKPEKLKPINHIAEQN